MPIFWPWRRIWFMRLTHCRAILTSLLPLLCLLLPFAAPSLSKADEETLDNKFLPAPRELLQRLSRGRQAAQQKEFNVAVEELGGILSPESEEEDPSGMQDYFIIGSNTSG